MSTGIRSDRVQGRVEHVDRADELDHHRAVEAHRAVVGQQHVDRRAAPPAPALDDVEHVVTELQLDRPAHPVEHAGKVEHVEGVKLGTRFGLVHEF